MSDLPKLVIRWRTDPAAIDTLLPPGLTRWGDPVVQIGVYRVPVHGEWEHGISTKVPATFEGTRGWFSLGIGIDQESAIFISRDTNGQPKFPCSVRYFRLAERIEASATHQGHTYLSFAGEPAGPGVPGEAFEESEWWIKVSPAVGGAEKSYDLPPRVVRVRSAGEVVERRPLDGELVLRPSPWDPVAELLPVVGDVTAELQSARHTAREISAVGPLDPDAFWPHVDTIGGSRWPGQRGAPCPGVGTTGAVQTWPTDSSHGGAS